MSRRLTIVLLALCCVPSVGAAAKLSLMQRIERLESLADAQGQGQARSPSTTTDLISRLDELQLELSRLRGELEVQSHRIEQLDSRQRDLYLDIDRRLGDLGGSAQASATGQTPAPAYQPAVPAFQPTAPTYQTSVPSYRPPVEPRGPTYTPPPILPAGPPGGLASVPSLPAPERPMAQLPAAGGDPAQEDARYTAAFDMLKAGRYDESARAFHDYLSQYPGGRYADNAQYWLGETAYVQRDFQTALAEFQKVTEGYPTSPKIPDALLKTGFIQYELQHWGDARKVLSEVAQSYPTSTAARLARQRLQQMDQEHH